jgi:dolichyl-phosphate beta-glucosyltransferase
MLSLIIPSYNGSQILKQNLPGILNYFRSSEHTYEIIIVDDGSKDADETKKVAEENNCIFIANPHNLGKGGAVRNGVSHAKGDFIFYTDVDIPFEYDSFDRFISYLRNKEFDIAIGDRTLPESNYFTEIPLSRQIGSLVFTFFVTRFITGGLGDTQCGFKGFKASVAKDLFGVGKINSFAFDVEVLYIALKRNYDIKKLPVRLRNSEGSTVSLLKHAPGMLVDIFSLKLNHLKGLYKKANS